MDCQLVKYPTDKNRVGPPQGENVEQSYSKADPPAIVDQARLAAARLDASPLTSPMASPMASPLTFWNTWFHSLFVPLPDRSSDTGTKPVDIKVMPVDIKVMPVGMLTKIGDMEADPHLCPVHAMLALIQWMKVGNGPIPYIKIGRDGRKIPTLNTIRSISKATREVTVSATVSPPEAEDRFQPMMREWRMFVHEFLQNVYCSCPFCARTVIIWGAYVRVREVLTEKTLSRFPALVAKLLALGFKSPHSGGTQQMLSFLRYVEKWFEGCITVPQYDAKIAPVIMAIQFAKGQKMFGAPLPVSLDAMNDAFLEFDMRLVRMWEIGADVHDVLGESLRAMFD